FAVPHHSYAGLDRLGLYAVLGIVAGVLAIIISKGLFFFEAGFRRLPVGEFWHPMIGALAFALIGLVVPRALGVGYDAISDVLLSKIAVGALLTLAVANMVAWWVALASATSAGPLPPL